MKYFARLWITSALAALVAIFVVFTVWLVVHLGFNDETISFMLSYITNFRLISLASAASVLIKLIEAAIITSWRRRKRATEAAPL